MRVGFVTFQVLIRRKIIHFPNHRSTKMQKAYDTRDSQAVSDPSTNRAQRCLTWQIGRDAVFSTWYGRKRRSGCGKGVKEAAGGEGEGGRQRAKESISRRRDARRHGCVYLLCGWLRKSGIWHTASWHRATEASLFGLITQV